MFYVLSVAEPDDENRVGGDGELTGPASVASVAHCLVPRKSTRKGKNHATSTGH